jgi:hypothetical protein
MVLVRESGGESLKGPRKLSVRDIVLTLAKGKRKDRRLSANT